MRPPAKFHEQATMIVLDGLPLELVALVLEYLTSEELVSCFQVCSSWRRVVGSFRGLWTRRCQDCGVPEHSLRVDDDPVHVFLSARRQRNYIRACKHTMCHDVRIRVSDERRSDEDGGTPHQVVYAGHGVVVAVMFRYRLKENEVKQQESHTAERGAAGLSGATNFTPYNELKQRYEFGYLLIQRLKQSGVGCMESCRVELEDKWKWPVVTNAFAAKDGSWVILRIKETWIETAWYKITLPMRESAIELSGPTWKTPDIASEHHPTIPYSSSCCTSCSAVALVKNKLSMRPPWEFGVDFLHLSRDQQVKEHTVPILNYDQMRLSSDVHANVVFQAFFFCKESASESDTCRSHKLVLWRTNDHVITVHTYSDKGGVSREPDATFSPAPQGKTLELSTAWGHTKMKLSSDFRLLGFLIARQFHLWNLETNRKLSTIDLEGIPGLRTRMMALGHVYSLFGTLHEGGEMVLVATRTGDVVWRCQSFLGEGERLREGPMEPCGVAHEEWMSDVQRSPPMDTPFLLFSPMNTPTYISGLALTI